MCAGLEQQAKQQLRVAQAACNQLMWQMPRVMFHFPQGVNTDVRTQLTVSRLSGGLQKRVLICTVQTSTHYRPAVLTPACAGHDIILALSWPVAHDW
jgi:hypothetical protein